MSKEKKKEASVEGMGKQGMVRTEGRGRGKGEGEEGQEECLYPITSSPSPSPPNKIVSPSKPTDQQASNTLSFYPTSCPHPPPLPGKAQYSSKLCHKTP